MKSTTKVLSLSFHVLIIGLIMVSCYQGPVDVTADIKNANDKLMEAYASGDANSLKEFYTADARLFPENSPILQGPDAIAGFFGAVLKMGIQKVRFETSNALSYGDVAIEEGLYTLYVPGDIVADHGKYIVTWKKENGTWKIHRDIWNTNNPATIRRAAVNDTVMIVINKIKADKVGQFEDYITNYLSPAAEAYDQAVKNSVRIQKSLWPDKDGFYTYTFIMDPMYGNFDYDMNTPLTAKYGKEKAAEYGKLYLECVKEGYPEVIVAKETGW